MSTFGVQGNDFVLDSKPFRIISGAIHYFRVVPEYWEDRLKKLKACGFNTVETYVPWNLHEPKEGEFDFSGILDIERFIVTAGELGLKVIVRPGPYICAEWEFGGFPGWLIADENMRLRCYYKPYLEKLDNYYDELIPHIVPHLCTNGGPVIAVQVENEYGSYGNDKKYLNHIKEGLIRRGVDCLLFTSDGPQDDMLNAGTLPDVFKTANFGSRPKEMFPVLRKHQPTGPLMCCEFWNGWFDHWDSEHHTRDAKDAAQCFDEMLEMGASVNFYMFHGGTNFGFMNGANRDDKINCTVTSYDYDSPVSECGDLTEKYYLCKEVIEKHFGKVEDIHVENLPKKDYGKVELTSSAKLFNSLDALSTPIDSACTLPMERVGQNTGFILYRNYVTGPMPERELHIQEVHDRAVVFVNGEKKGVVYRDRENEPIMIGAKDGETICIDILVENMGRVNYGPSLRDNKGITEGVRLGLQFLFDWKIYPLPLDDLHKLVYRPTDCTDGPVFLKGEFEVEECADTFLKLDGFSKGVAYINGFNLGRYWKVGPTKTMYVPAPLLKKGKNIIEIFEVDGTESTTVEFTDTPEL